MQDLVKIGKLSRLHGIKGALVLQLSQGHAPDPRKARAFFLEINGVHTPFFAREIKTLGKNLILFFDSVSTPDEAQKLSGKEVWLQANALKKVKKETDYTGFRLVDAAKGELGQILEVVEMPGQRMFSLRVNEKEVLLPFAEELIEKVDLKTRTVHYHAPEGLIDIYLA